MHLPELLFTFALGTILSTTFCQSISQQLIQPAMAAKSEKTIRRTLWLAVPLNGLFCVFIASIGLAAKANPAFNELGPNWPLRPCCSTACRVGLLHG